METFTQYLGKPAKEGKILMVEVEQFAQTAQLMLNDLAEGYEELDKDNDFLRGEMVELHKRNGEQQKQIDFIMENVEFGNETTVRSIKELYNQQL